MRELSAQQATSKRELAKRAQKEAEAQRQGRLAEAQMKVNAQMEAKRAARAREEARLAEELKQIKLKKAFLDADKEAVERSKFESLQGGARRELIARQETGIKNATNAAKIHDKETAQRLLNLQQEREIHEVRAYHARARPSFQTQLLRFRRRSFAANEQLPVTTSPPSAAYPIAHRPCALGAGFPSRLRAAGVGAPVRLEHSRGHAASIAAGTRHLAFITARAALPARRFYYLFSPRRTHAFEAMLKARLGLGVKTGLPTSSSWMQNTRQPLQNTGRPFDDTLQQTAPRVRTAEN
eukprot:297098-Pleurochrysis_carterae.AAC.1